MSFFDQAESVRYLPQDTPGKPRVPLFEVIVTPPARPLPELYKSASDDKVETLAETIASLQSMTGPRVKIESLVGSFPFFLRISVNR